MNLSMNERAATLVDSLVADADALGIEAHTLDSGARLLDCGAKARGGLQAGLGFATVCMGGLGRIDPIGVAVGDRTWPGVAVSVDEPAAACLAAQYAGWKLEQRGLLRDGQRSGPRAGARRGSVRRAGRQRAGRPRRSCAWRPGRSRRPEIVEKVAQRCGVQASTVTFLIAPHGVGVRLGADLGPRGRDRAAQAARARRRPGTGAQRLGLLPDRTGCQGRSRRDRTHQRRGVVRRHGAPVDRGRGRGGRRPRRAPALVGLGRFRDPVWRAARGRELELLRHRSDCCSAPPP